MLWAINPVAEKTVDPVAEKTTVCVSVVLCRAPVVGGGALQAARRRAEMIRVKSARGLVVAGLNSAHIIQPLFPRPSQTRLTHPMSRTDHEVGACLRAVKLESEDALHRRRNPDHHLWNDFRTHAEKEGGTCCLTERGIQLLQTSIGRIRFGPSAASVSPTTGRGTLPALSRGVVS